MVSVRRKCPLDYRMCNQTVTVYHWDSKDIYTRTVYNNAFFDARKVHNVDKTGSKEANSFLLILPCDHQVVYPKDKILLGVGGECNSREDWAALIPTKVPGLVVAEYIDSKYWNGAMVHLEVGG